MLDTEPRQERQSKTLESRTHSCHPEQTNVNNHHKAADNCHQETRRLHLTIFGWKGYSFTTSVSIRLLPGLGDDIFCVPQRTDLKILLRLLDYLNLSAWQHLQGHRAGISSLPAASTNRIPAATFFFFLLPGQLYLVVSCPEDSASDINLQRPNQAEEGLRHRNTPRERAHTFGELPISYRNNTADFSEETGSDTWD